LKIDCTELVVGANTVERERQNIADPSNAAGLAGVVNSAPAGSTYGLVTWNQPSGTQTVSGSVTATQATGTNLHVVVDSAPTTTVTGTITTTPPSNASTNLTQLNSVGLGSPSNYGTSPGAVEVQGVNAFVTNTVPVTGTFFQTTQPVSGTVTTNQGTANSLANAWTAELTDGTHGPAAVKAASTAAIATDPALVVAISPNNSVAVTGTFFQGTQPVSGTVTANQGTANTAANSWPVEVTDGTNVLGVTAHPLRVDPTGTTTQPVSGTVTVGNASLAVTQSTSPWVVGQSTAANLNATVVGTVSAKLQDGAGNNITSDVRGSERPLSVQILDASGNQITSFGGSGGNAAASATGSAVPASADYVGYNSGGNLVGVSTSNPLPVAQQGSVAVTGTFFQGTQPVSGTVTANQGTANTAANAWPVEITDGTNVNSVKAASTAAASTDKSIVVQLNPIQPNLTTALNVSAAQATAANLNATVVGSGNFTVVQPTGTNLHAVLDSGTTAVTQATGTNLHTVVDSGTITTVSAVTAITNAVTVTPPTLTKGTQGSTGFSVQNLKDAGRTFLTFTATAAAGVTSEALLSFSQNKGGTVTASVTSYVVTSGKIFRITAMTISVRAGAAAVPFSRCTLRSNTGGATTATSSVVFQCPEVFGISATSGVGGQVSINIPDGLEITGNGTLTIGMSHLDQATTNVLNVTICGFEY
jgi:hypothetical protein